MSSSQYKGYILLIATAALCTTCTPKQPLPPNNQLPRIELNIGKRAWQKINYKRAEAIARGFLESNGNDYVRAQLSFADEVLPAAVRLKGDWLDHLKGDKWSWRIKLDNAAVLGADQFSLQSPHTRYFLHEWVFHQILEQEEILTPSYEFVELWINGVYKGIYAFEAHFTEALLARQKRPSSTILKFNEDGFWQTQNYRIRYGKNITPALPDFEAATIEPFQKKRVARDTTLSRSFRAARQKLATLRLATHSDELDQLIELDYWARFFAIIDLTEAYHALRWHNMRFYYHPQSMKLYPIGFDGYATNGIYRWFPKPFLGKSGPRGNQVFFLEEQFLFALFNNPTFTEKYQGYLLAYTTADFLKTITNRLKLQLDQLQQVLMHEFPHYNYNQKHLQQRGKELRDAIKIYDFHYAPPFIYTIYDPMVAGCPTPVPLPAISIKAKRIQEGNKVSISNYYCQAITLEATGPKRTKPLHEWTTKKQLPAFDIHQNPPQAFSLPVPAEDDYIFYSVEGVDYWFKQKIDPWPQQDSRLIHTQTLQIDTNIFQLQGLEIIPKKKRDTLREVQILPADYKLKIPAGTQLVLDQRAAILIFGSAQLLGTITQPIHITSSDTTGRGIHFLQASSVVLKHVKYSHMTTFRDQGLLLNGSMSCFAKRVDIDHTHFQEIQAEDALNIIHCKEARLNHLSFKQCSGDGLDIDFSAGQLIHARFQTIGGDGLDLSASDFLIQELSAVNINDKGVSIGEGSKINLQSGAIQKAFMGIAAKDGSELALQNFSIDQCEFGLTVFSKKPYFNLCKVEATQLNISPNIPHPFALEEKQKLYLNQQALTPTHEWGQLRLMFYPTQ